MNKKKYLSLVVLLVLLVSCSMQERIVFNEDMGGRYESVVDLSQLMALGAQGRPASVDKKKEKMDTLVVFNEFLEAYKDSIATLPAAKQEDIKALRDFSMQMNIDEDNGVMVLTIIKDFKQFNEIERIAYDIEKVFDTAKKTTPGSEKATSSPASSMLSTDKVIYTFTDNTFRRTDPKALAEHLGEEVVLSQKTQKTIGQSSSGEVGDENDMMSGMLAQMDKELSKSTMTLEYVFPRKVISVIPDGASIGADGKTVTFEIDYHSLLNNKSKVLENFEVVLEEQ